MSDERKGFAPVAPRLGFEIDDTKIFILRKKEDGKTYKIHHDGREELFEPEKEK